MMNKISEALGIIAARLIGCALIWIAYNKIAWEYNLPQFNYGIFVCACFGLRMALKKYE